MEINMLSVGTELVVDRVSVVSGEQGGAVSYVKTSGEKMSTSYGGGCHATSWGGMAGMTSSWDVEWQRVGRGELATSSAFPRKQPSDVVYSQHIAAVAMFFSISGIATPFFGLLVDVYGNRCLILLFAATTLIFTHFMMLNSEPHFASLMLGGVYTVFGATLWPAISLSVPEDRVGTANGVGIAMQNLALFVVPLVVGLLQRAYEVEGECRLLMLRLYSILEYRIFDMWWISTSPTEEQVSTCGSRRPRRRNKFRRVDLDAPDVGGTSFDVWKISTSPTEEQVSTCGRSRRPRRRNKSFYSRISSLVEKNSLVCPPGVGIC